MQILLYEGCQTFIYKILQLGQELDEKRACKRQLKGNGQRIKFPPEWIQMAIEIKQESVDQVREETLKTTGVDIPYQEITVADLSADEMSIQPCNIFPFCRGIMTLSSLGYRLFRMYGIHDDFTLPCLKSDITSTVANRASLIELEYLMFLKKTKYPNLIFGYGQNNQAMLSAFGRRFFVDGFDPDSNTVIEFIGCNTHGCPDCYSPHQGNRFGILHQDAQMILQMRIDILKSIQEVRKVELKHECSWKREKAQNVEIKAIVEGLDLSNAHSPLNPRSSFRGGICGPVSLIMNKEDIAKRLSEISPEKVPVKEEDVISMSIDVNR